ncbi:MAG TPA: hypothetical protein VM940_08935 [Chthoniobacterales bacterium]|jgi:hypothetical protein|nr:hypothetical protein [Chthoniobacterales bacterium]
MKSLLLSAILVLAGALNVQATEDLIFDGGGYYLYVLVGHGDKPGVAHVRLSAPGGKDRVMVPHDHIQVKKFDDKTRVLEMRFTNKDKEPDLPASFSLSVKKKKGVLTIDGKKITGSFDWLDE